MKASLVLLFSLILSANVFAGEVLKDLEQTTFSCPAAALNAAAREAVQLKTAGTYQFSSYKIVSDSAQAKYEVGFTSNVQGEPAANYEVTLYCQQGWDPNTTVKVVRK